MNNHQNIRCTLRRCGRADGRVAAVRSTSGDNESFHAFNSILDTMLARSGNATRLHILKFADNLQVGMSEIGT